MKRSMKIKSCLTNLPEVEGFIEEVVEEYSVDSEVYGNMLISVTEAVTNAITHGNKQDKTKDVDLVLDSNRNKLSFVVEDQGPGFQYDELADPTEPENLLKLGGRGVFLMKNLSDLVVFSNEGSKVELQFKI